jgi:hypothetical protein
MVKLLILATWTCPVVRALFPSTLTTVQMIIESQDSMLCTLADSMCNRYISFFMSSHLPAKAILSWPLKMILCLDCISLDLDRASLTWWQSFLSCWMSIWDISTIPYLNMASKVSWQDTTIPSQDWIYSIQFLLCFWTWRPNLLTQTQNSNIGVLSSHAWINLCVFSPTTSTILIHKSVYACFLDRE